MNAKALALTACCLTLAPAAVAQNLVFNPSFESNDGTLPDGWGKFNTARMRTIGDGLTPATVTHSGSVSIEFPSGTDFSGFTTNVFNPMTLEFFDPPYVWQGGDVTVTGWYYIPSDMPLTANAGIKLEFRRDNSSIATSFETLSITGHTNNQWVQFSMTITDQQMMDAAGAFPPFATSVTVLPLRFGASSSTGTIFFDDIELTQGAEEPCLADTNGDGIVSPADFSAWVAAFNSMSAACDQNGDGICSPADFSAWVSNFNAGCP
ncbi:MAG: hypothetical protein KDA31_10355 [Phycisphaerales bacterium]|nr:hypothetical protein [Phycisphaerales bacterium]MCB9837501.1 hypothetical protein [Phycisphaera sp.]